MQIWPAIDLRGGKCVRLRQGDYQQETIYSHDPAEMAKRFVGEGAEYLHLVDLDGAREGNWANRDAVKAIIESVKIPCELGGGVREEETIQELLDLGLVRLVIGTKALKDPDWFCEMCEKFPDKLAVGIDAKEGMVATDGWFETSTVKAVELARQYEKEKVAAIIYTDIAKDGMLEGPNTDAMHEMAAAVKIPVIASGGVTTADDVRKLAQSGVAGCIIGRALYEGKIHLADALAAAKS